MREIKTDREGHRLTDDFNKVGVGLKVVLESRDGELVFAFLSAEHNHV